MRAALVTALIASAILAKSSASASPADPSVAPVQVIQAGLTTCSMENWSDEAFSAKGYRRGKHFSLAARGQRIQEYDRTEGGEGISLHSSFILYVACSNGVDLTGTEAFAQARDTLVTAAGLAPIRLSQQKLSPNAKAILKEFDLAKAKEVYAKDRNMVIFSFRQFSGRNRMAVWVVRREKGGQ